MMKKFFASSVVFFVCLLAAPVCFSEPATDTAPASKPTPVSISTKASEGFSLPLRKNTKSIVCVNRNFYDTQKFGNAFCAFLDEYSNDCRVLLAEFVPKEKVAYYDYVWTFQVKKWKDKNLDDIPEWEESRAKGQGKSQIFNGGEKACPDPSGAISQNSSSQEFSSIQDFKESQYNLLADTLRKHLDMQKIYEIMGLCKGANNGND